MHSMIIHYIGRDYLKLEVTPEMSRHSDARKALSRSWGTNNTIFIYSGNTEHINRIFPKVSLKSNSYSWKFLLASSVYLPWRRAWIQRRRNATMAIHPMKPPIIRSCWSEVPHVWGPIWPHLTMTTSSMGRSANCQSFSGLLTWICLGPLDLLNNFVATEDFTKYLSSSMF